MSMEDAVKDLREQLTSTNTITFDADGVNYILGFIERMGNLIEKYEYEVIPEYHKLCERLQAKNERLKASQQLGLYPIVKERHRGGFEQSICEECGHISTKDYRYIEKDYWICPICGKNVDGLFRNYCDNCGQKLERRDAE